MQTLWDTLCREMSGNVVGAQFNVWIRPLRARIGDRTLDLFARNEFVAKFVRSRFVSVIAKALEHSGLALDIVVHGEAPACPEAELVCCSLDDEELRFSPDKAACQDANACQGVGGRQDTAERQNVSAVPSAVFIQPSGRESKDALALPSQPFRTVAAQAALPLQMPARQGPSCKWKFTFEDFVVGPSNELAHAAARSMCAQTGLADVLFMCSQPGLGKTHLMQSVGSGLFAACNLQAPRIEYLSAEQFASQLRLALRCGEVEKFKARYRSADVLLLEDVHFLQDKANTQNELLGTVISLLDRGGKVVFSSSFAPRDLRKIDEQLLSRLSAGLIAMIDRPDMETRRQIIRKKAAIHQVILPEEVAEYLAENISQDVRQIESCLRNLVLKAQVLRHAITMDMARETLASCLGVQHTLTINEIVRLVCNSFGVSRESLHSKSRKQEFVQARNAAFYLARKHTDLSLQEIGSRFNRSHSTVLKGITSLEREISRQSSVGRQLHGAITLIERTSGASTGQI